MRFEKFKIRSVFERIETPKIKAKANDFPKEWSNEFCIPLLTAGIDNQGLARFAKKTDCEMILRNCLSVSANGANSGVVFYQPDNFAVLQDAYAIRLINREIKNSGQGLYLATALNKAIRFNHDWVNKAGWNKIKNDFIELPVHPSQDPLHTYTPADIDWDYMEQRISELEEQRISELEEYLRVTGLDDYELTEEDEITLNEMKPTKTFKVGEIFQKLNTPFRGSKKRQESVSKIRSAEFSLPVTNCKFGNNGIMYYGRPEDFTSYRNVLGVIYNGPPTEGQTYFHEEAGVYTDSYLIALKERKITSIEIGLYLTAALNKSIHNESARRYSRGNKATWEKKVENDPITLPVTSDGSIDFDYMECYIRALEKLTIANVVREKDRIIATTRQIVDTH